MLRVKNNYNMKLTSLIKMQLRRILFLSILLLVSATLLGQNTGATKTPYDITLNGDTLVVFSKEQEVEMYKKFNALEQCNKEKNLYFHQQLTCDEMVISLKLQHNNLVQLNTQNEGLIDVYIKSNALQKERLQLLMDENIEQTNKINKLERRKKIFGSTSVLFFTTTVVLASILIIAL